MKQRLEIQVIKTNFKYVIYLSVLFFLSACNTVKYLADDEVLLSEVETNFTSEEKITKPKRLKSELIQFYKQKPNTNFMWIPREWYYYRNLDPADTTWIKKWSKNSLGEEPSILDTSLITKTSKEMQNYLRNKKGFYEAVVSDTIIYKGKKAKVVYSVDPMTRYIINSLEYFTLDSTITNHVIQLSQTSLLNVGNPIDALNFNIEKQRIVNKFQNLGYANFNLNYVSIKGDSTDLNRAWDIFFEILPPSDSTNHKKYSIGNIEVFTDFNQFQNIEDLSYEELYDKKFYKESPEFIVRPSLIDKKIFLKTNDVFNSKIVEKTNQKLFNLETYKFIKLASSINPLADSLIDYKILMTPQKYLWAFDLGNEVFYSNRSRAPQNLVGFSIGSSLENRNALGGSEKFKLSVETGVEFVVANNDPVRNDEFINTFSIGVNNSLDFPKFTPTLNILKFGHKIGLLNDAANTKMEEEASSRLSLGFNYIDILNDYLISTTSATYGFNIRLNNRNRIVFNQTGVDYAIYKIRENFEPIIEANPFLKRSFDSTLFTGLLFKDLSYIYQSDNGIGATNWTFIANLEFSGLEIFGLNKLYNSIANKNSNWKLKNGIAFEKMFKLEIDNRWYRTLNKRSQLAARVKTGLSLPYGVDDNGDKNVVSFIKQFLVGGPSSIRAWRPMQLGPGNYEFIETSNNNIYFQRGDLLLEFNMEYRFDLFWLMEGALFFDGGNIWTLQEDTNRPGSKISSDFYKQIALGYGWGIRFDFNYFLIRFDFGYKLRSPFILKDTNSHYHPLKGQGVFGNFNVAVNYPF
ncbi:MAG: BamA/TamA family outer membrane protein [Saprospiraceae bacterium]|nr:BamA/TamA family outer membrane protein [Saprospiraceae bacterium]